MKITKTAFVFLFLNCVLIHHANSEIIKVPEKAKTIQDAINRSKNGDTILVANGTYYENIEITGKEIVLASNFIFSNDKKDIKSTVLNGNKGSFVIKIKGTNPNTKIIGFIIENAGDGVSAYGKFTFTNNIVRNTSDGMDYENNSGGICTNNIFELNSDDGIDLDEGIDITIDKNIIRNNGDDGIEIRLQKYAGETLNYNISNNLIINNGEDGIQIIDYPDISDRIITIWNNVISSSSMAGIGFMADGNTKENYEAAKIDEPIYIYNNTLLKNTYGICGGGNTVILNNLIAETEHTALKGVNGNSVVANLNLYLNGKDFSDSNIDGKTVSRVDPKLQENYFLPVESPLLNKGIKQIAQNNQTYKIKHQTKIESVSIGAEKEGFSGWLKQLEVY